MFGIMFWAPLLIRDLLGKNGETASHGNALNDSGSYCGEGQDSGQSGASSAIVALLTTVPYAAAALSTVVVAHHADMRRERRFHTCLPLLLGGLCLGATPFVKSALGPAAGFACLVIAAGLAWGFQGPFFTWPAVFLKGSGGTAAFALINSLGSLGGFIGPYTIGVITHRWGSNLALPMLFMSVMLIVSGIAVLLFPVSDQMDPEPVAGDVECASLLIRDDKSENVVASPPCPSPGEEPMHSRAAASLAKRPSSQQHIGD